MEDLYNKLIKLVNNCEAFFYKDIVKDDEIYRIFNYRIASYTDFLNSGALECRGHMFNITDKKNIKLVCLPLTKFFNLNENPFTMDIDLSNVKNITLKMDGSIISTFLHKGEIEFKSKSALNSPVVEWTKEFFSLPGNKNFKSIASEITKKGYTVNFEYVSPKNRIIIPYKETNLIVLHIRKISTGEYVPIRHFRTYKYYDELIKHTVKTLDIPKHKILDVYNRTDIEGIVMELNNKQFIKLKTFSYVNLHKTKESLSDKHIVECVLNKNSDDLKILFTNDTKIINNIVEIENVIISAYNKIVNTVEQFYRDNNVLDQKSYALKAKSELKEVFHLGMELYHNKLPNYNKYILKNYDTFLAGKNNIKNK